MFNRLQNKWKVNGWQVLLILLIFALGGSITGYVGKRLMNIFDIEVLALYIIVYILLVTFIWPVAVLIVSLPFGQFSFFRNYIVRIGNRLFSKKKIMESTTNKKQSTIKHLVIFASGAGSNAQQIINYFRDSTLAKVVLIVCNKKGAGVITIAEKENIPVLLIEKQRFFKGDGYLNELKDTNVDLIILAGFLWKIPQPLIDTYPRRIINIHPALLPKYGGKGMYGQYVHESVLNEGEVESGITIHYVDEHYDNGDIIFQTACPVLEGDTAETLAHRIHQLEHLHYPVVIEELINSL